MDSWKFCMASNKCARSLTCNSRSCSVQWSSPGKKLQNCLMQLFSILSEALHQIAEAGNSECDRPSLKDMSAFVNLPSVVVDLRCMGSCFVLFCGSLVRTVDRRDRRRGGPYQTGGCADFESPIHLKEHNFEFRGEVPSAPEGVWHLPERPANKTSVQYVGCLLHNPLLRKGATQT